MLPKLIDISPSNLAILDERTAYEHFHGKTIDEAVVLFRKAETYVDDLTWMGDIAFDYYVDAYIIHLTSGERSSVDICMAMHIVVARTQMNRATAKLPKLIDAIEAFGTPSEPCDRQLAGEYATIARGHASR